MKSSYDGSTKPTLASLTRLDGNYVGNSDKLARPLSFELDQVPERIKENQRYITTTLI